jgi:phosphoribosylglycinamide formyltransferase-1
VRVAVLASGRGSNFDALARAAADPAFPATIVLLASDREDAPALERARRLGIPARTVSPGTPKGAWTSEGTNALLEALADSGAEAICLAGFMRVVPAAVLAAHPGRILNVHPSLLPAFPGLRAQRQAIRAGVKVTGCTVHFVDEGIDTGPIVLQAAVPVEAGDDEESLSARILAEEHRIYPEALRLLAAGRLEIQGRRVLIHPPRSSVAASPGGRS